MTVSEIRAFLKSNSHDNPEYIDSKVITSLLADRRKGVRMLGLSLKEARAKLAEQKRQFEGLFSLERELHGKGFARVAGLDEAGRGALAGPVAVGCVILRQDCFIPGLRDSKKLTENQREALYEEITAQAAAYKVVFVDVEYIDRYNIYNATIVGMERAIRALEVTPDHLVIDAIRLKNMDIPQLSLVGADDKVAAVSAVSILAKVERDRLMEKLAEKYPGYLLAKNKGYATRDHYRGLIKRGPTPIHRMRFLEKFWARERQLTLDASLFEADT